MSYETRAYDNEHGDPVVVLVATGTHDVSRLVALLQRGNCEQGDLGDKVLRQVRRHNGGRAALQLLAAHGGPDFLFEPGLRTEFGWAPEGDASDVRVSKNPDPDERERWARREAALGGSVFEREVTEWRQEP